MFYNDVAPLALGKERNSTPRRTSWRSGDSDSSRRNRMKAEERRRWVFSQRRSADTPLRKEEKPGGWFLGVDDSAPAPAKAKPATT